MKITIVEAIPVWATSYICNTDPTGINEKDKLIVDQYYNKLKKHDGCYLLHPIEKQEPYFTYHPAFGLACDVLDWYATK